jgi:DNA-binding beta-propeller fold protein YncE
MTILMIPALLAGALAACGLDASSTGQPIAAGGGSAASQAARATPGAASADDVARGALPTPAIKVAAIWSTAGGPQSLDRPIAVALGPDGRLYVVDAGPARINVFDRGGRFLAAWGSAGGDAGQFRFHRPDQCRNAHPEDCAPDGGGGVAVDGQGRVYVADHGNHRVQVFSSEGQFLATWGREGGGPGEFRLPQGIAVDRRGNVYVSDGGNSRVQTFDSDGQFLNQWGGRGDGEGQFVMPGALAIDQQGNVLVVETWNPRVQAFTAAGGFLWGARLVAPGATRGPTGLAVDSQNHLYLTGPTGRVQRLSPPHREEASWGGAGAWDAPLVRPAGLAIDAEGDLYVADAGAGRLVRLRQLTPAVR